jgi:dienelactone hydrolase
MLIPGSPVVATHQWFCYYGYIEEEMIMNRADLEFNSSGRNCAAWLYRPEGTGPFPCVILAHGFGGVREARLDAYAECFTQAGLAALVFDYRHFGASQGEPRQLQKPDQKALPF